MTPGPIQIALVVLLALIFFGRGRISEMMGDVGKGIKSFKKGISEEADAPATPKKIDSAAKSETVSEADKTKEG